MGNVDDPDSEEINTWHKIYEVDLGNGYGIYAYSETGKHNTFGENGYKDWKIYLFYTQENGKKMLRHHFKKPIKTENKTIEQIYKALDTLAIRIKSLNNPDSHIKTNDDVILPS